MEKVFIKERIRYYRESNKLSARNLSLELGMSTEYINQVETGNLNPSLNFIISFCDYFHITLGEFFNEENKYPMQYTELIKVTSNLSINQINALINLIKEFNKK